MAKRFGRNQKRQLREKVEAADRRAEYWMHRADDSEKGWARTKAKLDDVLRHQLATGRIPLRVESFISPERYDFIMHAIYDERCANLHYQHTISPHELERNRNAEERERFGLYLGRAIADRLADHIAKDQRP